MFTVGGREGGEDPLNPPSSAAGAGLTCPLVYFLRVRVSSQANANWFAFL